MCMDESPARQGFDMDKVAACDDRGVDPLLADRGIVCTGRKIRGTMEKAQIVQEFITEHGSFHDYLRTLDGVPSKERSIDRTPRCPDAKASAHGPDLAEPWPLCCLAV